MPLRRLAPAMAVVLAVLAGAVPARAYQLPSLEQVALTASTTPGAFKICDNQTYALCATAACFVLNGVAYCRCHVTRGDSISESFAYGNGKDVCTVNAEGVGNGYMVSTYSLPFRVRKPAGDLAVYTCPGATSTGSYAQCDGGLCFRSTQGQDFPGFARTAGPDQIMCSCPITTATAGAKLGYQIIGPHPCQPSFFRYCSGEVASTQTGARIYVGAPTGTPRLLTKLLYGYVPGYNVCAAPM